MAPKFPLFTKRSKLPLNKGFKNMFELLQSCAQPSKCTFWKGSHFWKWIRVWVFNDPFCVNRFPQNVHWKGLSPVCVRIWMVTCALDGKPLPHTGQSFILYLLADFDIFCDVTGGTAIFTFPKSLVPENKRNALELWRSSAANPVFTLKIEIRLRPWPRDVKNLDCLLLDWLLVVNKQIPWGIYVPRLIFIWGVKNGKVNQRTTGPVSNT